MRVTRVYVLQFSKLGSAMLDFHMLMQSVHILALQLGPGDMTFPSVACFVCSKIVFKRIRVIFVVNLIAH